MWTFCGSSYGWSIGPEGTKIDLHPDWHQLTPDLSGPNPDFEFSEVTELNEKDVQLQVIPGDFTTLCSQLAVDCRFRDEEFKPPVDEDRDVTVHNFEDYIAITWYRSEDEIAEMLRHLQAMGTNRQGGYFHLRFKSSFIVGEFSMGSQQNARAQFFREEKGAALISTRSIAFGGGAKIPAKPDRAALNNNLQDYF